MVQLATIEQALEDLRLGRMIILVDDEHREHEGDLVIAAEKVTPEAINFMAQEGRGLICLTLPESTVDRLNIPMMPERNKLYNQAAFTTSIEATHGVTTGVSAYDRAHTIQVAINPKSTFHDISMPGHVFPLKARQGGVLERQGHTEGSVDLAILAGLQPAGVICEIMKEDGHMAKMPDLIQFAEKHKIKIVAINDLVAYRLAREIVIDEVATANLPINLGDGSSDFVIKVFKHRYDQTEHVALVHKDFDKTKNTLVRLHSECLTGDLFGSLICDCGEQLHASLKQIAAEKGILLYMRQEGRGIGLSNKIKAYHLQQTQGLDTVEANHKLGFLDDHRHYGMSAQILQYLGVQGVRLLTNNPRKLSDLESFGIKLHERVPLEIQPSDENKHYLQTKKNKLGHLLKI